MNKVKNYKYDKIDDGVAPKLTIEVPIYLYLIEDCYKHNDIIALSEFKIMMMELLGSTIDEIFLKYSGYEEDSELMKKLKYELGNIYATYIKE